MPLTKYFIVILRFAPFQRCLRFLQFGLERPDIGVEALESSLFYRRFEICNGSIEFFEVEVDACTSPERLKRCRVQREGGFCISKRLFVPFQLRK